MMIELGQREAPARESKRRRLRDSRELSNGGDLWDRIEYAPVSLTAEEMSGDSCGTGGEQ